MPLSKSISSRLGQCRLLFCPKTLFARSAILPWLLFAVSLGISLFVYRQMSKDLDEHIEADFKRAVAEASHDIGNRMTAYEVGLRATAAFVGMHKDMSREQWGQYVQSMKLEKNFPALQAIAWAPNIKRADLNDYAEAMRAKMLPNFAVYPAGSNEDVTPVTFIEPFNGRNLRAIGYDMSSDPARRRFLERARDTDEPSLTSFLTLISEDASRPQPGAILYLPVYSATDLTAPAERRAALRGYVLGAFRMRDFMQSALSNLEPHINVKVYDESSQSGKKPIYVNSVAVNAPHDWAPLVLTHSHTMFGQSWQVEFTYFPGEVNYYRSEAKEAVETLLSGIAISCLLFLFLLSQTTLRVRASTLAADMTKALQESEQRWQFALESGGDGVVDWNVLSGKIFFSPRAAEIVGFLVEEMPKSQTHEEWLEQIHPDDRDAANAAYELMARTPAKKFEQEFRLRKKDGSYVWILARAKAVETDAHGRPVRIIGVRTDISDRRRRTEQLRLAAKVLESSSEGIVITDSNQRIVMVNAAFSRVTGYSAEEALGATPHLLASGRHDAAFYQGMWGALRAGGFWQGELWNRRKGGAIYPEWLTINHVLDERGRVTHYVGIFTDISARKSSEARIEQLAHFDALTLLPNRILLQDRLEQAIAATRRTGNSMAVIFLDLDHFKTINDTLGHHWGDELLKMAAQRLKAHVRDGDTVARQGGDEFIIVLPNLHVPEDAALVARKLIDSMSAPYELNGKELAVTCSIGISVFPEDAEDIDSLMKHADAAMYHAKQTGRNNFQFFTKTMSQHATQMLALETALRYAVPRNQLELHFQPQMRLRHHQLAGVEALVRWRHPERGLISPGEFIPIAEDRGLIVEIGKWVLNEACRVNRRLQSEGGPAVPIAVNISAHQFRQPDFCDQVVAALEESGLEPRYLELEMTESIVMRDVQTVISSLEMLKKMGVSLSIDDFGTGYSSLSYLKRLPIDKLKIDQSFVRDISVDADDAAITAAIINLAQCLNMEVIAEGVESAQQVEFLRTLGCDEIQGYWLSKPLPEIEFLAFMRNYVGAEEPTYSI